MYWSMTDCHTARPVRATVAWNASFAQVEVLRDKRLEQIQQLCIGDAALEQLGKCPEVFGSDVAVLHVDADVAESRLLLRVEQKISRNYVKSHNASSSPPLNGGQRRRS